MMVRFAPPVAAFARSGRNGAQSIAAAPPCRLSVINSGIPLDHADPGNDVAEGAGPGARDMINQSRRITPSRSDRARAIAGGRVFDEHAIPRLPAFCAGLLLTDACVEGGRRGNPVTAGNISRKSIQISINEGLGGGSAYAISLQPQN
ncbi:MAG: hypothetical protein AAF501_04735 [Pseudomonadota bacterium]